MIKHNFERKASDSQTFLSEERSPSLKANTCYKKNYPFCS